VTIHHVCIFHISYKIRFDEVQLHVCDRYRRGMRTYLKKTPPNNQHTLRARKLKSASLIDARNSINFRTVKWTNTNSGRFPAYFGEPSVAPGSIWQWRKRRVLLRQRIAAYFSRTAFVFKRLAYVSRTFSPAIHRIRVYILTRFVPTPPVSYVCHK